MTVIKHFPIDFIGNYQKILMLDTCIQMNKVFLPIDFIGISPNSVCFKYSFFGPCKARYQRSSGEGSELQSEEARVQILVEAVLFRIFEKWIGG